MKATTRVGILLPAVFLLAAGCATKGWVRETLDKRSTEIGQQVTAVDKRVDTVDQRVGTVDGKLSQESQNIEKVGARVNTLEGSVTEVSEAARNAREVGNSAMAKADDVDRRVTRLWTNRHNPRVVDTVQIFFGFDKADLDDRAQTSLTNLAKDLQSNPNLVVELTGHTDPRGSREYNYQLSQRRVESVRRFLVEKGIQLSRIQQVGMGPIADSAAPDPEKRRVTAKMMLEQD